jgi:hypothetical protein
MKDKFLHTFRREPDQEFAQKLYQRLVTLPPAEAFPHSPSHPSRKMRRAWVFATLVFMFLIIAMVPGVRARFEEILKQIGGLTVFITDQYPGVDDPTIVPSDVLTLEEARARLDFEFNLPTWVPEGLTLSEDEVRASNITPKLSLTWLDENMAGRILVLSVSKAEPDVQFVVGPNSVTEVMVNDITATLIRGGWYVDTQSWRDDGSRTLRWQMNGVAYQLTTGNETWGGLSDEELIQVAESIP